MDDDNIIILSDETGKESKYEFVDLIEYDWEQYVFLLPLDSEEEEDDDAYVLIMRVDGEQYAEVEDPETLDALFQIFKDTHQDEFDFTDE